MTATPKHRERGSITWALLVALALTTLAAAFTASVVTGLNRSKAGTDATMLTQYTDVAVADAVARLNAGDTLPASLDTSAPKCERVTNRFMCIRYWALPVPGSALDPVRYDLVSRAWVDDGDMLEPTDGKLVRQVKLPLEVLTYQTAAGVTPELVGGDTPYIAYHPTPSGLFANAIHSFTSTSVEGPGVTVRSYNSVTGDTGTHNAAVSSAGWLSFGAETQADQTVLYGGSGILGDHVSRCTGEVCSESGTRVVTATYATPTDADVQWMRDKAPTCTSTFAGDWVASANGGTLPAGISCINGSLIIDTPTVVSSPLTTLYVNGTISVRASLNTPLAGQLANPASLAIFSTGQAVSFDAPLGSGFSVLIYAPLATCGNNPANPNTVTYFGSLVCGTVSLGGHWEHLYDDAAVAQFVDPVVGMKKTFSPGVPVAVDFDSFTTPPGWTANSCPVAAPSTATGYWKLDEAGGILARDSSGNGGDAGWRGNATRVDGVCGKAAVPGATGAVVGTKSYVGSTGATIDYWAKAVAGTSVKVAGINVTHDTSSHVTVTVGVTAVKIPFTVQNHDSWHHYVITVTPAGVVTLYVDGLAKGTAPTGINPGTLSGALTIGTATAAGAVDEVAFYPTVLTATQVAQRYTFWTSPSKISSSVALTAAGTPFSAPAGAANNTSTPTALKVKWTAPTGTFPTTDPLTSYRVDRSADGATGWAQIGATVAGTATTFTQANPPVGIGYYRVCAIYNGDTMCSGSVPITTLDIPTAPVVTVGAVTTTTAAFSWTTPTYAASFESQYRLNGGTWTGAGGAADPAVITHALASPTITQGPTTQGTRIEIRVRAVNAAGSGPWSATATANLGIQGILANSWSTVSSYPYMYGYLTYSGGPMCPAGTVPQAKMRDQLTNWGGAWNGYGSYATGTAGSSTAPWMASYVASYDVGANQLQTIRCYNPSSGNAGPEWGEHGPITIWHPIPSPTGQWAGIVAYRTAGWGASCVAGTTASYQWQVVTVTFNTGPQGWTFGTSWANTGQAWGSGTVWMTARCEASGRYSGTVSASGGF